MTTMKNKTLTLMIFSVFALALLGGLVSAATVSEWTLDQTNFGTATNVNSNVVAGTFTSAGVTFDNSGDFDDTDGASATDWSTDVLDSSKYYEVTISPKESYTLTLSDVNFDYSSSVTPLSSLELQYSKSVGFVSPTSVVILADVVNNTEKNSLTSGLSVQINSGETLTLRWFGYNLDTVANTFSINNVILSGTLASDDPTEIQECSTTGDPNSVKLEIKRIRFDNLGHSYSESSTFSSTFGKDEKWFPLDEIEVEIEIENDGIYDIDDIEVEWGLYDTENEEWVIDMEDENDFNLKDGKEEMLTISFVIDDDMDLDLEDLADGDHYIFYVTATGVIDDNDYNDDFPEGSEDVCTSDSEAVSIIIEGDFVVLDNINLPEVVSCGDTVTVTATAWNIGDEDQDEVTVRVSDRENSLGVQETITVGDIDAFDKQGISFDFDVPRSAEEGDYSLLLKVIDDNGKTYENDFDDDKAEFTVFFEVTDCSSAAEDVLVSALLISEAKAGQSLTVRVTITNTMFDSGSFSVSAAGFGGWASSVQIDQPTVLLDAGESKDVLLTFDVASDAKGSQTFFVEILSEDGEVTRQPVQVDIQPKSLFGFTGASILGGGNAYLWGIGLLNIILVVVIIIVAVRIARR